MTPGTWLLRADAGRLPLRDGSVHLCVTSPPYYWQRVYNAPLQTFGGDRECAHEWRWYWDDQNPHGDDGTDAGLDGGTATQAQTRHGRVRQAFCRHCGAWHGQLGLEPTPSEYIAHLVAIFGEVHRVLHDEGQCFVVIDDKRTDTREWHMIPERFALAMQDDGWRLEDKVMWQKLNCMPGWQTNRFTHDFENVWLFNKSRKAFFDMDAVREPHKPESLNRYEYGLHLKPDPNALPVQERLYYTGAGNSERMGDYINYAGRSRRAVWSLSSAGTSYAHYATFPPQLVDIMVRACSSEAGCCPACGKQWRRVVERTPMVIARSSRREEMGEWGRTQPSGTMVSPAESHTLGFAPACTCDLPPVPSVVLDPFGGTGTTGVVAQRLGRRAVCCDLSGAYLDMARERTGLDAWQRWHGGNGKVAEAEADLSGLPLFAEAGL